jgi:hypothetical protein
MIIISIHTHKALERAVCPPLDFMPPWKISFCIGAMSAATGPGLLSPQLGRLDTNNLRAGFSPLAR